MKKNIVFIISVLLIVITVIIPKPVIASTSAVDKAYKKVINKPDVIAHVKFDVNHDGIKELAVQSKNNYQSIYTVYKGKLKKLAFYHMSYGIETGKKGNILRIGSFLYSLNCGGR